MKKANINTDKTSFILNDIETTVLLEKIEIARKQIKDGEFLTQQELDKEIDEWTNISDEQHISDL